MSKNRQPWISNVPLFSSFFREHRIAQKEFAAALVGVPVSRVLALHLRHAGWAEEKHIRSRGTFCGYGPEAASITGSDVRRGFASEDPPPLSMQLTLDELPPVVLDIIPAFGDGQAFPFCFSCFREFRPLCSSSDFHPQVPFLRIFLTLDDPKRGNPFFYGEFPSGDGLTSTRVLNLSASFPAGSYTNPLLPFSRLLTVSHSAELLALVKKFPQLTDTAALLLDALRERELAGIFSEQSSFSPDSSRGISAMCSLNRLLLKENRLTDLKNASQDPETLRKMFQEFQEKGFLKADRFGI